MTTRKAKKTVIRLPTDLGPRWVLKGLVHEAVERRLDRDLFEREVEIEANERSEIARRVARFL